MLATILPSLSILLLSVHGLAIGDPQATTDDHDLTQLLQSVPEDSLHSVLDAHLGPKFQSGVFANDERGAISALHNEDPALATRLVDQAKKDSNAAELAKRQIVVNATSVVVDVDPTLGIFTSTATRTGAATSAATSTAVSDSTIPSTTTATAASSAPAATSDSTVPSTSTASTARTSAPATTASPATTTSPATTADAVQNTTPGVMVPVTQTSTNSASSVVLHTTSTFLPASQVSASAMVPVTTTNNAGQTMTTSAAVAAVVVSTTDSRGSASLMTSPVSSVTMGPSGSMMTAAAQGFSSARGQDLTTTDSFGDVLVLTNVAAGEVVTATDAQGHIIVTTLTPGGGLVNSVVLETTTNADGSLSTITQIVVAGQTATQGTNGGRPSASATHRRPDLQGAGTPSTRVESMSLAAAFALALGLAFWL